MERMDYLVKYRRAKKLETLELMVDRAVRDATSVPQKANAILAGEDREKELQRTGEPIWM